MAAAAPALRLRTYTIAVWAQLPAPEPTSTRPGPHVLAAQTGGSSLAMSTAGVFVHEVVTGTGDRHSFDAPVGSLDWSAWHHLAITSDGTTARTLVDGSEMAHWALTAAPAQSQGDLVIGSDLLRTTHTAGRFAHLRVYTDALTEEELRRDMADDEAALAAFVRTHPLEIELANLDGQPVLYIDDGSATQQLTLRLTNSSRQDVELRPGTGPVSAQNRHVALL
ncbi:MAG: LamG domain-containing protein, partial [Pseudonocardiaceae bacterium]